MPDNQPYGGFASFAEMRQLHSQLRRDTTGSDADKIARIDAFVAAVAASGRSMADATERENAQGILDYWAAELIALSEVDAASWTPPRLAALAEVAEADSGFVVQQAAVPMTDGILEAAASGTHTGSFARIGPGVATGTGTGTVTSTATGSGTGTGNGQSFVQIRLAATARQWTTSGNDGYLLSGDALDEAERFVNVDPDIRRLVDASRELVARRYQQKKAFFGVLALVLLGGFVLLLVLWREVMQRQNQAVFQGLLAVQSKFEADVAQYLINSRSVDQVALIGQYAATNEVRNKALESATVAQSRLGELERTQRLLDGALQTIRRNAAVLNRADVPAEVWAAAQASGSVAAPAAALERNGYNPDFIGLAVPFPRVAAVSRADYTRVQDYFNFSLVMQPLRRMARVSASNVDRQQLRVLPQGEGEFRADDLADAAAQNDAEAFRGSNLQPVPLVSRQEVAWGALSDDPAEATRELNAIVYTYSNAVPQWPVFRSRVWSRLERWVLTEHNKTASRVSIFSGPVFRDDDPTVGALKLPRSYWKIAVSQPLDSGNRLVVDAFLVPQAPEAVDAAAEFDPERYRRPVEDIERLTGLDFGALLHAPAITASAPELAPTTAAANFGAAASASVELLNAADANLRKVTAEGFVNLLRNDNLPDEQKLSLVRSIADLLDKWAADSRGANGLFNAWVVLDQVAPTDWNRPEWRDTRDTVRRFALKQLGPGTQPALGEATRAKVEASLARLNWNLPPAYQVDLQFKGITRDRARSVSSTLRGLGWNVRGEEAVAEAPPGNEVRYGDPADEAAARLLAADLRLPGETRKVATAPEVRLRGLKLELRKQYKDAPVAAEPARVVRVPAIGRGKLEIWIGR
ncbi:DNA/RNA endonuclease G (NUC1) [Tahibacter aquaticus]|uniref:DNA/RNA endonuclease G (NUC1) n=1 Tax=Tahibacter aquaticus TaxID=520092 RepID=A0A4R6Z055_9GAMM|nr:DNA/RNA non-specific endonuclease [Tahibacter aquaticus]TDR44903.1 DNA/RNA endonuclease G (NUC1) [Tahibacter aquaticus]